MTSRRGGHPPPRSFRTSASRVHTPAPPDAGPSRSWYSKTWRQPPRRRGSCTHIPDHRRRCAAGPAPHSLQHPYRRGRWGRASAPMRRRGRLICPLSDKLHVLPRIRAHRTGRLTGDHPLPVLHVRHDNAIPPAHSRSLCVAIAMPLHLLPHLCLAFSNRYPPLDPRSAS